MSLSARIVGKANFQPEAQAEEIYWTMFGSVCVDDAEHTVDAIRRFDAVVGMDGIYHDRSNPLPNTADVDGSVQKLTGRAHVLHAADAVGDGNPGWPLAQRRVVQPQNLAVRHV